eukprot:1160499-Pelagomonas_calceolata.AAC.12
MGRPIVKYHRLWRTSSGNLAFIGAMCEGATMNSLNEITQPDALVQGSLEKSHVSLVSVALPQATGMQALLACSSYQNCLTRRPRFLVSKGPALEFYHLPCCESTVPPCCVCMPWGKKYQPKDPVLCCLRALLQSSPLYVTSHGYGPLDLLCLHAFVFFRATNWWQHMDGRLGLTCCAYMPLYLAGAQFGGKYFCHDVQVIRMPRHGASCPVGIGVSCSAGEEGGTAGGRKTFMQLELSFRGNGLRA